ncbi:MAG: hypothetical protein ACKN9S_14780, partial [Pirellula sp.]
MAQVALVQAQTISALDAVLNVEDSRSNSPVLAKARRCKSLSRPLRSTSPMALARPLQVEGLQIPTT